MKRVPLSAKERVAALCQQGQTLEELGKGKPPFRLHDDPLFDEKGRSTKRDVYVDGPDGGRDDPSSITYQEAIAQTVLDVGLMIPAGGTAFKVGARELFALANETHRLYAATVTMSTGSRNTRQVSAARRIDDLLPIVKVWFERLKTQVKRGRPVRPAMPAALRVPRRKTPPPDQRALREREKELAKWNAPRPHPDFPKMLYRGKTTPAGTVDVEHRIVATQADEQHATAEGWFTNPAAALQVGERRPAASDKANVKFESTRLHVDREASVDASPPASPTDARPPLTISEAAERLTISVDTVERMEKRREIRTVTIGKRGKRVPVAEVERLLANPEFRFRHDR